MRLAALLIDAGIDLPTGLQPATGRRCSLACCTTSASVDVDHFKTVNDTHGHEFGDKVLKHVATHLESSLRPSDVTGRYGGEEFIVGLPRCSLDNAHMIAERMRASLVESPFVHDNGQQLELSISIGAASVAQQPGDLEQLIHFADQAMYAAKESGRNCARQFPQVAGKR